MNKEISNWEEKNKELVERIENFYLEYESSNKEAFEENEYAANSKMLKLSGRIFKKEIEAQVKWLVGLNESFLAKSLD